MEIVGTTTMNLLTQAPAGALSATHRCSLKFTHPIPPLFTHRRPNNITFPKPLTLTNAGPGENRESSTATSTSTTSDGFSGSDNGSGSLRSDEPISFVGQDSVPLEGVIQFEKPDSSSLSDKINKWGWVALLAGGDVAALLLFSAIGRFSHGFSVFDPDTLRTADPFVAGWFLSAYFLGGFGEDGRGKNGLFKAFIAATQSWSLGIPVGLAIRAATVGHIPPINFIIVTMGSTAVLLIGWRTLLFSILPMDKPKKNDIYKSGGPFEFLELLTSLVRRW
ncbi:hypothetical protein P3S67_011951 [Capsicum chacoense]|uniref:Uncharacterized protein n=1 Tax=Capsicum annuum TaxID=4072 RepID=A0A1U8GLE3_CAPAN|nr:uncharacterized protein LOC107867266 [Capsicum annuum]KAF3659853.1 putative growth-regulating factor 6-like [Capsicum annuum]PHT84511.1 hypothetical protein T459_12954 [Capsicum annuum]